jgi:hypothetical protein
MQTVDGIIYGTSRDCWFGVLLVTEPLIGIIGWTFFCGNRFLVRLTYSTVYPLPIFMGILASLRSILTGFQPDGRQN